jgi:hypothetical protein
MPTAITKSRPANQCEAVPEGPSNTLPAVSDDEPVAMYS